MGCIICNSKKIKPFGKINYSKCFDCGIIYIDKEINKDDLISYYESMPPNYLLASTNIISNTYKFSYLYNKYLCKDIPIKKNESICVLDFGCFNGDFLSFLKMKGVKGTFGYELNTKMHSVIKEKGIELLENIYENINILNKFDVIFMLDVVEHLNTCKEDLKLISKLLKPNGKLVITTPDTDSIYSKLLKSKWSIYDGIEHIQLFNRKNISDLLNSFNFKIIKTSNLWKETTLGYFIGILNSWKSKRRSEVKKGITKRAFNLLNNTKIRFYAGEFIIIAQRIS